MASTIQIVPKFSFPYVETYVNDYTEVIDTLEEQLPQEPIVRYVFPFISSKGVDNVFIRKRTRGEIVKAYGDSAFSKYGQPLMQVLHVAESPNAEIFCMRVMPDDATYANSVIGVKAVGDKTSTGDNLLNRKFTITFTQAYIEAATVESSDVETGTNPVHGVLTATPTYVETDTDSVNDSNINYATHVLLRAYDSGRGDFGNFYRFRISKETTYQKEYGIKFYNFETLSTEKGIEKISNYVGCAVTSSKYNNATLINDVIDDQDIGTYPVKYNIDETVVEGVYNAYIEWCEEFITALETARTAAVTAQNTASSTTGNHTVEELIAGTVAEADQSATDKAFLTKYTTFTAKIADIKANSEISIDEFDIFFGDNISGTDSGIVIRNSASTAFAVDINAADGNKFKYGSNGSFTYNFSDASFVTALTSCYEKAFDGTYDKRILSAQRVPVNAIFDANYPDSVKQKMTDLCIARNDGLVYLDAGIISSLTINNVNSLIKRFESMSNDNKISRNIQHYYIKEPTSKKRIPVTISYFLAYQYTDHVINNGTHIPFVKSYARLSGHIRDSLYPTVDNYEYNFKEILTENRFNYFETIGDNIFQRATQNTAQSKISDLLEENNIATLYELKRAIENDITNRLYDFSDADVRSSFKDYEDARFASWKNSKIKDFSIDFRMNEWEADRSILHCYLSVTFRGLMKRAILEIDINKRDNSAVTSSVSGDSTVLVNDII